MDFDGHDSDVSMDLSPRFETQDDRFQRKTVDAGDTIEIVNGGQDKVGSVAIKERNSNEIRVESVATEDEDSEQGILEVSEVKIGDVFFKKFGSEYYRGKVLYGPRRVVNEDGSYEHAYHVKYDDGDREDMTAEEIFSLPTSSPQDKTSEVDDEANSKVEAKPRGRPRKAGRKNLQKPRSREDPGKVEEFSASSKVARGRQKGQQKDKTAADLQKTREKLLYLPWVTEEEVDAALAEVGPNNHQKAMAHIQTSRQTEEVYKSKEKFRPHIGMKIRKAVGGAQYFGEVTNDGEMCEVEYGKRLKMWEVTYEDGTQDDMDWYELLQSRANRPTRPHPIRGRQLGCLELFSGCGMISQEFADRKWRVRSVDNNKNSNASDVIDVMSFELADIGFVPDFVWLSPPCFTYSRMAGGRHRSTEYGEYEKTQEAEEHNEIFLKCIKVIYEILELHPHMIFVIENPEALLQHMPLMIEMEEQLGLHKALVHYCVLGRDDKKPTNLWTNDFSLFSALNWFKCGPRCPYREGNHPASARGSHMNSAEIPPALAEEVAEHVHSKFNLDRIRYKKEASIH